jgi:TonB family protein
MPAYPMSGPDPTKPASSALGRALTPLDGVRPSPTFETDFADLAAKFAAHSGGAFSSELTVELALEIVFNEIVEQACLATGATGAAIVLERDGEMVCRASSGTTAPELGSRLDRASGLSGECIRTRQICRCDDAQADPRADREASRRLGVRSVMVQPLLRKANLIGVLEVFSTRPAAFGERDERTLQALAQRVLKNLNRAAEPIAPAVEVANLRPVKEPASSDPLRSAVPHAPMFGAYGARATMAEAFPEAAIGTTAARRFDFVTWALAATVLGCAVLLGVLVGRHLGWEKALARGRQVRTVKSEIAGPAQTSNVQIGDVAAGASNGATSVNSPAATATVVPDSSASGRVSTSNSNRDATDSFPPGSLRVYENGREVFRLPASTNAAGPRAALDPGVERVSSVDPEHVIELSPSAAEDSLLYRVEPDYPQPAREQKMEGPVALDVHIGRDGAVQEIKLLSGSPLLAQAATEAVKQWRFKPRAVKGQRVEMQTKVTLNFRLPH